MFISARVDRWSAAARLLIGASPPVSHTHIDSLSSLLVRRNPAVPSALRHRSSHLLFPISPPPSFLSSLLVSSSSSISSSPLASPFIVIFVLSVSPQLSAFLSFSPPLHRPYSVLRFSPCRPIIRSLFTLIFSFVSRPHTRKPRNLHYFPRTYIRSRPFPLVFRTPTLSSSLSRGVYQSRGLQADRALRPTLSRTRSRFFPLHGFFSRCYCRLSNASQFAMADFPQLRNGNFNT